MHHLRSERPLRCRKILNQKGAPFFATTRRPRPTTGRARPRRREETMKNVANQLAVAAFFLGLGGFYFYTQNLKERLSGGPAQEVLFLTQDLEEGQILEEQHLVEVELPSRYIDARRIPGSEKRKVLGAALVTSLHGGESLVWSDLRDAAARRGLSQLIAPGHRAFRLPAKANPLGSLLQVGDQVDVLVERGGKSDVLLEQITVLALGDTLDGGEEKPVRSRRSKGGVTLSVTQSQATALFGAIGDLLVVLRNPEEKRRVQPMPTQPSEPQPWVSRRLEEKKEIEHVR